MNTKNDTATPTTLPLVEDVRAALRQAFSLGQTYFSQSDSDSVAQNRMSDKTAATFRQFVKDTCDALAAAQSPPIAAQQPTDLSQRLREMFASWTGTQGFDHRFLIHAADEIERYYGGTLAWKKTAERTDSSRSDIWTDEQRAKFNQSKKAGS